MDISGKCFKVKADGWLVKKNNCTGLKVGLRAWWGGGGGVWGGGGGGGEGEGEERKGEGERRVVKAQDGGGGKRGAYETGRGL